LQLYFVADSNFPESLLKCGLTKTLLLQIFTDVQCHKTENVSWHLSETPELGFYRELHQFLKRWPMTQNANKSTLGKVYLAIDKRLQAKGLGPNNTYLFIERSVASQHVNTSVMTYGLDLTEKNKLHTLQMQVDEYAVDMQKLTEQFNDLKKQMAKAKKELIKTKSELKQARNALEDTTNKLHFTEVQHSAKYQSVLNENLKFAEELDEYLYCANISDELSSTCKELSEIKEACTDAVTIDDGSVSNFSFKTRIGKKYSPAIRKLYYCLLSNQIPPGKIAATIKSILKAFFPALDTDLLALPKERCAGQMRIDEMCTISEAHKASVICEQLQAGKTLHLNTDGTTLAQKKINSIAINNTVISIDEVHDGTAETVINDVSKQLQKLREWHSHSIYQMQTVSTGL